MCVYLYTHMTFKNEKTTSVFFPLKLIKIVNFTVTFLSKIQLLIFSRHYYYLIFIFYHSITITNFYKFINYM